MAGDVPAALCGVRILELDLGSLTAGCMMPGEFEERLKVGPQGLRLEPCSISSQYVAPSDG